MAHSGSAAAILLRRAVSAVLSILVIAAYCPPVGAQGVPLNMDLGSTQRSVNGSAGQSASINVGGTTRIVTGSDALTAGERVALTQMLQTGLQSIILGVNGNA